MRLVVQTKIGRKATSKKLYVVTLPNWYDVAGLGTVMDKVKRAIPDGEKIAESTLYNDTSLTIDEKNDLDLIGEIRTTYIPLVLEDDE